MEFSRPEHWSGHPFPFPGDLPHPGTEPRSPALEADSLPAKPQEKPKNTGMGSLSLLQGIFLTQEIEPGSPALHEDSLPTELSGKPYTVHSRHPKMSLKQRYSYLTDGGSGELAGKPNVCLLRDHTCSCIF